MILSCCLLAVVAVAGCQAYCETGCKLTTLGTEYRGNVAKTVSGRTCQRWGEQFPHKNDRNDVTKFPLAKYNEQNYCRNPDKYPKGPWCYTTDPAMRWEYCAVPKCSTCKLTKLGTEYRGNVAKTVSGRTCQRWDSQSPHNHTRNDLNKFPLAQFNQENYCRNPDHESDGPWCYTTDASKRWEYCDIKECKECKTTEKGFEYRGNIAKTKSGKVCQRWDSQFPHNHTRDNFLTLPQALFNEENYCRNPDSESGGPWCYTTDPAKRWEYCAVPKC